MLAQFRQEKNACLICNANDHRPALPRAVGPHATERSNHVGPNSGLIRLLFQLFHARETALHVISNHSLRHDSSGMAPEQKRR